jgi:hypothetical protein
MIIDVIGSAATMGDIRGYKNKLIRKRAEESANELFGRYEEEISRRYNGRTAE